MPLMFRRWILQAILGALVARAGTVYTNYTVDDTDSSITYSGAWEPSSQHPSPLDYGGYHTLGTSSDARAVFTFKGVAVYYLAPLWPYQVDSYVSLDDGPPVLVGMTAPPGTTAPPGVTVGDEVVNFDARWSAVGLENTIHTLTITRGPSTYAISDGFRYTVAPDDTTSGLPTTSSSDQQSHLSSTSQQAQSSAILNSTTTSSGGLSQKNLILVTAVCSVFGTLLLIALFWCLCGRKKNKKNNNQVNEAPLLYNGGHPGASSGFTPSSYSPVNTMSQVQQSRPGSDWYPPGGAAAPPPAFAVPMPMSMPMQTPAPMYPYHDMRIQPGNPAFDPQRLSQLPAANVSVTTLPPPAPLSPMPIPRP